MNTVRVFLFKSFKSPTGGGHTGIQPYRLHVIHITNIRQRQIIREAAAEFLGVMILILFGNGVDCQVVLSGNPGVASSSKGVCSNCFAYRGI